MKKVLILFAALFLPATAGATVTSTASTVSFTCTNSTGPFPFTFPALNAGALQVTEQAAGAVPGVMTVLTADQWTATPVNNSYANGGSITLVTACPTGDTLTIARTTEPTQQTVYSPFMPALYANVEANLDQLSTGVQDTLRLDQLHLGNVTGAGSATLYTTPLGQYLNLDLPQETGGGCSPGGSQNAIQTNNAGGCAGSAATLDSSGNLVTPKSVTASTSTTFGLASGFKTFYVPGDSIGFGCCHTGNVQSLSITSPGSGQTDGTYTISATGGSGYGATASVTIAGGVCTSATPRIPGWSYATTAPTFSVSEGGTPCTLTPTIFSTPFADAVAAALGISGGNYQNVSISGSTTADMASFWMTQAVNANKANMLSVSETGINDISASNAGANSNAGLSTYQSAITAEDIILSTPYQLGDGALGIQTAAARCTSPWAASTLQDPWVSASDPNGGAVWPFQMATSTVGASCKFSVFGTVVNIFYTQTASSNAQATVYLDGANFPASGSGTLFTMPVTDALSLTVSSATRTGSAVTYTYTGSPAPTTGQQVVVTAMSDPTYNGLFWVTGTGSGTFTVTNTLASASSATGTGVNGGYNSAAFSSFNNGFSRTFIPQVLQIQNLSPGTHTVKVVITQGGTGNNFYLDGASGNQGVHQVGGPAVVQMGILRTESQFVGDTLSSTWEQTQRNAQGLLQGQGYAVSFAETRGAIGNNPGGDISNYMLASFTPTGTVTSGSNTITGVSSTSGMGAGIYISDAGVAIPLGSRVASVTSNSITLTQTITGVTIATAGTGQTPGIFPFGSSGGTSGSFDLTANGQVLVDATGACVAAWIDSPGNFTLTPTLNSPVSGGTPCTLTPVFSAPTATATETLRVFSQQPHPDYGHAQMTQAVLNALNFNRPPNQQIASGAAVPVIASTIKASGTATLNGGLTVSGTTALNGQTTVTADSAIQAPLLINDTGTALGPPIKVLQANLPNSSIKQILVLGQGATTNNGMICNLNFTSAGSTSNFIGCGLYGSTAIKMGPSGAFYIPSALSSGGQHLLQIDTNGLVTNTGGGLPTPTPTAYSSCSGTFTSSTTIAFNGFGSTSGACTGGASGGLGMVMQTSGTLSRLTVRCATHGVGTAGQDTVTIWDAPTGGSAAATALTLAYDSTVTGNSTVQDLTHTVSYAVGDIISVRVVTQATETLATCAVSFGY